MSCIFGEGKDHLFGCAGELVCLVELIGKDIVDRRAYTEVLIFRGNGERVFGSVIVAFAIDTKKHTNSDNDQCDESE